MRKTVCFVTPAYNSSLQLKECYESLKEQTNPNWEWVILNDMSNDDTLQVANSIVMCEDGKRERVIVINHDHRKFDMKSIYDYLKNYNSFSEQIIAVLDAGDTLCNENTVDLILKSYDNDPELDALWTAHTCDIDGVNISRELPENINPYQYPWVSSHLKTFKTSVFKKIKKENFQDLDGNWFKAGYEQPLYLPILYLSRKRKFLDEICYFHKFDLNQKDKQNNSLVRSRGYIQ